MSKQAAHIYFRKRCQECFGVVLTDQKIEEIEQLCHDGSYFKICDQHGAVGLYRVKMGKEMAAVAYDRDRETVLTILPIAWTSKTHKIERERALVEAEAQIRTSYGAQVAESEGPLLEPHPVLAGDVMRGKTETPVYPRVQPWPQKTTEVVKKQDGEIEASMRGTDENTGGES